MKTEENPWKPKSKSTLDKEIVDDKHLNSSTNIYLVAWFTFAIILYFFRFSIASIGFLIFSSDVNTLFLTLLLDGPILLLSIYISHGLIFRKTNLRKVFPWTILVFLGGYSQFSDPFTIEVIQSTDVSIDLFKAIYFAGFGFFIIFGYKYFSSLTPTRWVAKIES
jgi:hypothetical protein